MVLSVLTWTSVMVVFWIWGVRKENDDHWLQWGSRGQEQVIISWLFHLLLFSLASPPAFPLSSLLSPLHLFSFYNTWDILPTYSILFQNNLVDIILIISERKFLERLLTLHMVKYLVKIRLIFKIRFPRLQSCAFFTVPNTVFDT